MLEADGEDAVGLDLLLLAVAVDVGDADRRRRARPRRSIPGSTGSPPRRSRVRRRPEDLRIDQEQRLGLGRLVLALGDVDGDDAARHADLDRRQGRCRARRTWSPACRSMKPAQVVVDALDGRALQTELAVGEGDDIEFRHAPQIWDAAAPGQRCGRIPAMAPWPDKRSRSGRRTIRRNPLARVLAGGKFKPRVVKRADTYKRRPKHRKPPRPARPMDCSCFVPYGRIGLGWPA